MIAARAALLAALLVAAAPARAQPADASDVAPPLRAGSRRLSRRRSRDGGGSASRRSPRAMPMPKPGSAPCCSIAGATREAVQTLQHAAERRLGRRRASPGAGLCPGRRRHAARRCARARAVREGRRGRPSCGPQINVGMLYFRGQGTPRDLVQARAWLEKAAASNDPYALYALGRAMDESAGRGAGRSGARRRSLSTRRAARPCPRRAALRPGAEPKATACARISSRPSTG